MTGKTYRNITRRWFVPSSSSSVKTGSPQTVGRVDLKSCRQDRVNTHHKPTTWWRGRGGRDRTAQGDGEDTGKCRGQGRYHRDTGRRGGGRQVLVWQVRRWTTKSRRSGDAEAFGSAVTVRRRRRRRSGTEAAAVTVWNHRILFSPVGKFILLTFGVSVSVLKRKLNLTLIWCGVVLMWIFFRS